MERVFSVSDGVVTFKSCSMASIDGVRVKGKAYASVGYFSLSFFLSSFIFIFFFPCMSPLLINNQRTKAGIAGRRAKYKLCAWRDQRY